MLPKSAALFVAAAIGVAWTAIPCASGASGTAVSTKTLVDYQDVILSPAATAIASVDVEEAMEQHRARHNLVAVRSTAGKSIATYDPCSTCMYSSPAWSPDGRSLAFLARDLSQTSVSAIFVASAGRVRRLVSLGGSATKLRWSSDGTALSFLLTAQPHDGGHGVTAYRRVGVIAQPNYVQRIMTISALGGAMQARSPDTLWVYDYDWRGNSGGFIAIAAEGDADNHWYHAELVDISDHGVVRVIAAPPYQIGMLHVSSDGRKVAFIGGLMSDFSSDASVAHAQGGDVFMTDLGSGATSNLTQGFVGTFNSVGWSGADLIAGVTVYGSTGMARIDPSTRKVTEVEVHGETIYARDGRLSMSADGRAVAYCAQSYTSAPHLMFGAYGAVHVVTQPGSLSPAISVQDVRWQSDGRQIQGWLLLPRARNANSAPQGYPLLVWAHGGPAGSATPLMPSLAPFGNFTQVLLRSGYAVFSPNVRGSSGAGESFLRANINDLGNGPLRDILTGVDKVEQVAPIDEHRLGLFGRSYGGFLTMWAATHTDRFKAIWSGAGMSDWGSYYSETVIPAWVELYLGGPPYTHWDTYDRASPIRYIQRVRTPTLLTIGELDSGAAPPQMWEFWQGLIAYKVPTKLVIYPGEPHAFHNPVTIAQRVSDVVGWFNRWLREGGPR